MSASDNNTEPPAKRRRDDTESPQEEIVKHGTLYLENGNIVIFSLPEDNIITAFKVYKEYLSLQSAVFEGMLSMPSPPEMEMYDNVPFVRLQDEAKDLLHFLKAIHDPTSIPTKKDFFISVDKVRSVFKLSKKYQADKLLACVKRTLSEIWPETLLDWDDINGNGYNRSLPEPCHAIALARDHDMPELLPVAFYHLFCSLPYASSATDSEDGEHWGLQAKEAFYPEANFVHLSREEILHLVRGSYAIRQYVASLYWKIVNYMRARRGDCKTNDPPCIDALEVFTRKHVDDMHLCQDPVGRLRASRIRNSDPDGICEECLYYYVDYADTIRNELWECLRELFGV